MRQIFGEIGWEKKAMVFFALVTLMVVFGPFDTYNDLTLYERIVFWVVATSGVGFFMHILMLLALNTPWLGKTPKLIRLAIGSAVAAIPSAAIVLFINQVFRPLETDTERLPVIWLQIFLLGVFIGPIEYIDWREKKDASPVTPRTKFHERLPERLGDDVISLSMQDHYVEVTTSLDKHMILLRMSDAISELEGLDGLKIHRSHWVARRHLRGMEKNGGKNIVRLSDGRMLPVSGTFVDQVSREITANVGT